MSPPSQIRIKQAELEALQLRKAALTKAIGQQEAEMQSLMTPHPDAWAKNRLPNVRKALTGSRADLAQVEAELKPLYAEIEAWARAATTTNPPPKSEIVRTRIFAAGTVATERRSAAAKLAHVDEKKINQVSLADVAGSTRAETEKNLDRLLADAERSGSVLLIDEADALFTKRTEVKDSHDRYANVEVAYLLQRLEQSKGAVVYGVENLPRLSAPTPTPTPRNGR